MNILTRFSGFTLEYELDILRLLSDKSYFGPSPTTGCSWQGVEDEFPSSVRWKNRAGRWLQKRHGSYGVWKSWDEVKRDSRFAELDRRIPLEDPERPRRRQSPKPINWEYCRAFVIKSGGTWDESLDTDHGEAMI